MKQHDPIDAIIRRDQAIEVLQSLAPMMASNVFVSCSFAVMIWESIPHAQIFAFLATNAAINITRAGLAKVWLRWGYAIRAPDRVLTACWIGALLSGCCWAGALLACAYHGQAYTVAVGLAYCGVNAGSIIQSKAYSAPAYAFILPNIVILIVLFAIEGLFTSQIIALNLTLLTILMIRGSMRQERHFCSSSRLKHEATELAASLRVANVAAGHALSRLERSATHDHLTGLSNRAAFEARLTRGAAGASPFWILLIDLDRFKAINDTFGHATGDQVLVEVGRRLRDILGPEAVVARLGGDEFAVLVGGQAGDRTGPVLAQAIVDRLDERILASGQSVQAGASVGLAHFPEDGETLLDLQINADFALYAAKLAGRSTWRRFTVAMRRDAERKQVIERDLPEALKQGAIRAWFQPQVDSRTGHVVAFEALLRWKHPQLGWVAPPDVVAAAAATRQSRRLTHAILHEACRMLHLLDAIGYGGVTVSINVSPDEFGTYPIAVMVAEALSLHRVCAARLAVEITEEAVYSTERGGADVEALTKMGVGVVVDDFRTACSSMASLRKLRVDGLKVDRSFVQGIAENRQDRTLVEAILVFSRTLGVTVVAEGVETEEQARILRGLGCPILQGYHFARPMPVTEALVWMVQNECALRIAKGDAAPKPVRGRSGLRALA